MIIEWHYILKKHFCAASKDDAHRSFHKFNIRKKVIHVAEDSWINAKEENPIVEAAAADSKVHTSTMYCKQVIEN